MSEGLCLQSVILALHHRRDSMQAHDGRACAAWQKAVLSLVPPPHNAAFEYESSETNMNTGTSRKTTSSTS
jgi:hypothetical protein